jgi:hypothetical protein
MAAETVRQTVLLDYPLICANPAFGAHDAGEPAATGASLFLPQQADGQGWSKSALAKADSFHRTPRAAATRLLQLGGAYNTTPRGGRCGCGWGALRLIRGPRAGMSSILWVFYLTKVLDIRGRAVIRH